MSLGVVHTHVALFYVATKWLKKMNKRLSVVLLFLAPFGR